MQKIQKNLNSFEFKFTDNLLALIRKLKEAAGYKNQCTKSTAFLYTKKSSQKLKNLDHL